MANALRYLAFSANVLFLLVIINMCITYPPYSGLEYALYALGFVYAALNLAAYYNGPDREERLLQRQVRKAELRRRLKDLESHI